jgi:hypothetical protein
MTHQQPLLEPSGTGDLNRTPFGHVLLYALERNMSGTLLVGEGPDHPTVRSHSAAVLLCRGSIASAALSSAPQRQSTDPAQAQLLDLLVPLCARTSGAFSFYVDVDLVGDGATRARLHPYRLLAAALRGPAREDIIAAVIEGLGGNVVHLKTGSALDELGLSGSERAFIERLRERPAMVSELCDRAALPAPAVRRLLYLLRITKCITLTAPGRRVLSGAVAIGGHALPSLDGPAAATPAAATERRAPPVVLTAVAQVAPGVDQVFEADALYREATLLLRQGRYAEARELVRQALQLNPQAADYLALRAWLEHLCDGDHQLPSEQSTRLIAQALRRDPQSELAHFYNALLLKRAGRPAKAARHFARALAINPANMEAAREVRLHEMRSQRQQSRPRLLDRLLSIAPRRRAS